MNILENANFMNNCGYKHSVTHTVKSVNVEHKRKYLLEIFFVKV